MQLVQNYRKYISNAIATIYNKLVPSHMSQSNIQSHFQASFGHLGLRQCRSKILFYDLMKNLMTQVKARVLCFLYFTKRKHFKI